MSDVLSSGLTLTIPSTGDENWGPSIKTLCFQKISEHDHTGSGKGLQLGANSLSNGAITLAKMADIATDRLIGRDTAGTGVPEALTVGTGLSFTGSGGIGVATSGITLAMLAAAVANALVPTGAVLPYAPPFTTPSGFLLCDGSAVSRATYSALFAIVGTTYGVGDGSTTFNVPNMVGRFPLGKAASGTGSTVGNSGGNIDHTHTGPSHTHTGPSHSHALDNAYAKVTISTDYAAAHCIQTDQIGTASWDADSQIGAGNLPSQNIPGSTGITTGAGLVGPTELGGIGATGASGTGATGTANPPFLTLLFMIKT